MICNAERRTTFLADFRQRHVMPARFICATSYDRLAGTVPFNRFAITRTRLEIGTPSPGTAPGP